MNRLPLVAVGMVHFPSSAVIMPYHVHIPGRAGPYFFHERLEAARVGQCVHGSGVLPGVFWFVLRPGRIFETAETEEQKEGDEN